MRSELAACQGIQVESVGSPHVFYREFAPLALHNEAVHGLMLALCTSLRAEPTRATDASLLLVRDETGTVCGAAMRAASHTYLLYSEMSVEAAEALAEYLVSTATSVDGLHGPIEVGQALVSALERRTDRRFETSMELVGYELTSLIEVPPIEGHARLAVADDREQVIGFVEGFHRETGAPASTGAGEWFDRMRASRKLFVWEHADRVVAMAGASGETPNGQRVVAVYVPPDQRGRGYASAITATVSRAAFVAGKRLCFLYAEAHDPVPHRMYQRLGYRPIGRFANFDRVV